MSCAMRDSFSSFPIRESVCFKRLSRSARDAPGEVEICLQACTLCPQLFQLLAHRSIQFLILCFAALLCALQTLTLSKYLRAQTRQLQNKARIRFATDLGISYSNTYADHR